MPALAGKYVGFNSAWPYQVNTALMQATGKARTRFMHCLPAFHNLETEVGRQIHEKYGLSEARSPTKCLNLTPNSDHPAAPRRG